MSDSFSPILCNVKEILSKISTFTEEYNKFQKEEYNKLQDKIKNLYLESGCTKKEIDKDTKEKLENIKKKIIREKEFLETEIQRNRPKNITVHKKYIKEAKQQLRDLGELVSPDSPEETLSNVSVLPSKKKGSQHFIDTINRDKAKGTRKKRGKASRRRQIQKIKKTR